LLKYVIFGKFFTCLYRMLRSVLACAAFLVAVSATGQFDEIVAAVNSNPNSTWVAQAPDRFGNFADVRMVCGTW
jgi:hypothetical protein